MNTSNALSTYLFELLKRPEINAHQPVLAARNNSQDTDDSPDALSIRDKFLFYLLLEEKIKLGAMGRFKTNSYCGSPRPFTSGVKLIHDNMMSYFSNIHYEEQFQDSVCEICGRSEIPCKFYEEFNADFSKQVDDHGGISTGEEFKETILLGEANRDTLVTNYFPVSCFANSSGSRVYDE